MKYLTFTDLTIGQYQEVYKINSDPGLDDVEKQIATISLITGLTRWEVEEFSIKEFNRVAEEISILFSTSPPQGKIQDRIKIHGKKYFLQLNPRKLTAGQYIDLQHFMKGNVIENLHKILACLIVPRKSFGRLGKYDGTRHEIIAEGLLDYNYHSLYSTCVFFLSLWRASIKVTRDFLSKELQKTQNPKILEVLKMDFENILDGYSVPVP